MKPYAPLDGARCRNCDSPIEAADVIQHMPFNTGTAIRHLWHVGNGQPSSLTDVRIAQDYVQQEVTRLLAQRDREEAPAGKKRDLAFAARPESAGDDALPLLGDQDMAAFREEALFSADEVRRTENQGRRSAEDAGMLWARPDAEPVTFMISLGSRTSMLKVEGDLTVGLVTDAIATKQPFQLPAGSYTLAYASGGQLRAVSRDATIAQLAGEEGHGSRRYIILTCA